jgi:outer membrane lipoprotein-sorting protein
MKNIYIGLFLFFILLSHALTDEITFEISKNWNQIKTMSGTFQQTDLEGNVVSGKFYFLKPYQSKFEYDNQPENIITNESLLRIVDSEGYQIDSYPIGNNIIKKILSYEININEVFDIRDIRENSEFYELDLFIDREDETGRAILYFDKNTLDLKKWELIDEFENKTVLEFTKIKKNIFISEKLFVVKYKQN